MIEVKSICWSFVVNATGGGAPVQVIDTFELNTNNYQYRLHSLTWLLSIYEFNVVEARPLNLYTQTTQRYNLYIVSNIPSIMITGIYENPTFAPVYNGNGMYIYKPGQYQFKSFFFQNSLLFNVQGNNSDPLVAYTYEVTVITETERL